MCPDRVRTVNVAQLESSKKFLACQATCSCQLEPGISVVLKYQTRKNVRDHQRDILNFVLGKHVPPTCVRLVYCVVYSL